MLTWKMQVKLNSIWFRIHTIALKCKEKKNHFCKFSPSSSSLLNQERISENENRKNNMA